MIVVSSPEVMMSVQFCCRSPIASCYRLTFRRYFCLSLWLLSYRYDFCLSLWRRVSVVALGWHPRKSWRSN